MATKVVMEALSPTMEEGRLIKWLKREGDRVTAGDTLAEVETDKAVMELVARGDGVLRKIVAAEGTTLDVGALVGVIGAPDEDVSSVVAHVEPASPSPDADAVAAPPAAHSGDAPSKDGTIKASPLARRMAREQGIDLRVIQGTGPGGRVIRRDLGAAPPPAGPSSPAGGLGFQDVPLSQVRKTIARRLVESIGPIPHFFLTSEIDMDRAARSRAELNALDDGPRISFNDIVLRVVAEALVKHPECNAWWQGDHIRYFEDVHLSVAVAIDDGLITPVIRHAHHKTLRQIAIEVRELADRARGKQLKPDEYTGGTFSVSNLGMFGIEQFTGVINPPEAGLLAVGSIAEKPVAEGGQIVVRKRMRVTMSCDHRVIDGATGARFLQTVRRMLENPLAIVW